MTGRQPSRFRSVQRGLTLIELMVVMVVLAILATIAIPTYDRYTRGARRADGKAALTAIVLAQERAFSVYQTYVPLASLETLAGLDKEIAGGESPKGKYDVAITSLTAAFFRVDATPKADDPDCGTLYITSVGLKSVDGGVKGKDYCW